MHFIVFVADGLTTHGFGEEARDVRHLRGTGCRGSVEDECCSHILFVLGLHTEEHEDQWLEVGAQSAECLPPSEVVPAAKTESVAGGGMVLRRRACFSCFSSADPEAETHVGDHRQGENACPGSVGRADLGAPLARRGERPPPMFVRIRMRRGALRSAASSVGESCEAG